MRAIHVGEVLREDFLAPLDMTPAELAAALHVEPHLIDEIVLERRAVTAEIASRLARYFGGDAESWMNMQQTFDLKITRGAHGQRIATEITPRTVSQ
jgi:addiction module HigA family antidote